MSNLIFKGLTEVEGMKFHDIEGGFGQNKKLMLVKDIAEIHNRGLKDINRNINNNIKRFKKGIDILDLKNGGFDSLLQDSGFSSRDVSISNNIYILSERGYSKLLKILEDDFAWEQYEKLVDGYFNMRANAKDPFKNLSKELQAVFILDRKYQEQDTRITRLENKMTIDYSQQEELNSLAKRVVIQALGGKDTPAYKELNKKAFSTLWRDYKRIMQINSYKNTAVKDFIKAKELLKSWKPNRELELMIKGANSQVRF